jgi:hypothetical protein
MAFSAAVGANVRNRDVVMKIFSMLRFLTVPLVFVLFRMALATPASAQGVVILPIVPTISINATVTETREPFCDPAICDAAPPPPAMIRVTRTGGDLTTGLSVFVAFEGSASNGVDYAKLPDVVRFPAGAESVELYVEGLFDQLAEGDEIVVAKLLPDPSMGPIGFYQLDPHQSTARVLIRDREMSIEPMVSIVASSEIAEETSYPYRRLAFRGVFTIARSGPTNHAVSVFVHYSGSAQPGVDFPALPWLVTIPAGAEKVDLVVEPTVDNLSEPIEFLDAKLDQCPPLTTPPMGIPCYAANIDPARSTARIFLRDDGITTATLELTSPRDGSEYRAGQPIRLAATAIDLEGAITYLEFFDGLTKIGESSIFFIRQPDPGTPIIHEFEWSDATVGSHELTARAVNAAGSKVSSPPVKIRVSDGLPLVSIEATVAETMEPSPTSRIRPGLFTLRRTGDTAKALRVWVNYGGAAIPARDYSELPGVVEIPVGASSVELQVVPLDDDLAEAAEPVVATLVPSPLAIVPDYEIDPLRQRAQVVIHDNGMANTVVTVVATDPFAREGTPGEALRNGATFTLIRSGNTNLPLAVHFALGGTAVAGTDFRFPASPVVIPAGERRARLSLDTIDDSQVEPVETVTVTLLRDPTTEVGYDIGLPGRAAAIIVDNDRQRPPCVRLPDGLFNLCLPAGTNACFRIEVTRDLSEWTPIAVIPANEERAHYVDPDAAGLPRRFYRAVPVPCE